MDKKYDLTKKKDYMEFVKTLRINPSDMRVGELYPHHINDMIRDCKEDMIQCDTGKISDGYHTFDDLYHHRTILFAALVNTNPWRFYAWKSKCHHDPIADPMYEGYFIVGVDTPYGPATYHCNLVYWDLFDCKEVDTAPPFDGHTPDEAIYRILKTSKEFYERKWAETK